jgi:hypothetical protein
MDTLRPVWVVPVVHLVVKVVILAVELNVPRVVLVLMRPCLEVLSVCLVLQERIPKQESLRVHPVKQEHIQLKARGYVPVAVQELTLPLNLRAVPTVNLASTLARRPRCAPRVELERTILMPNKGHVKHVLQVDIRP